MGSFYTNITLKGPTQDQVAEHLRRGGRDAYVSPTIGGISVVYDRECEAQDVAVLQGLASDLSRTLASPALAVLLHDSDVLFYQLFADGELRDEYNSAPDYFDDEADGPLPPQGGDARTLCEAFGAPDREREVAGVLGHQDDGVQGDIADRYIYAEDRHRDLARALGFPAYAADVGYRTIEQGDVPEGIDPALLVRTGDSP